MSTFVLIPGAGGNGSYWSQVVTELESRGHRAIAVDIRQDDPALGLPEYAEITTAAIGEHRDVVLVAQSLGGVTAPMVARNRGVRMIVFVNAMIPRPGETPGQWWDNTGAVQAREAGDRAAGRPGGFDVDTHFLHDLSEEVRAQMSAEAPREPADTPFGQPCQFSSWANMAVKVLIGRDDRFFPAEFQRRVARDRLGISDPDVIAGGHLIAKSNPAGLAEKLLAYAAQLASSSGSGSRR